MARDYGRPSRHKSWEITKWGESWCLLVRVHQPHKTLWGAQTNPICTALSAVLDPTRRVIFYLLVRVLGLAELSAMDVCHLCKVCIYGCAYLRDCM